MKGVLTVIKGKKMNKGQKKAIKKNRTRNKSKKIRLKLINNYIDLKVRSLIQNDTRSMAELSKHLGISYPLIKEIKTGKRNCTNDVLYKISQFWNKPIDTLFPPKDTSNKSFECFKAVYPESTKSQFKNFIKKISKN